MSDRTHPIILDHFKGVMAALTTPPFPFPVVEWERPKDTDETFRPPPYVVVRTFPSAAQFDGPLTDSQIDIILRIQLLSVGMTESHAINLLDLCRARMKKSLITITGRYVQDVRWMVVTGGLSRDDDLPTPFFYHSDIYEILTTPA